MDVDFRIGESTARFGESLPESGASIPTFGNSIVNSARSHISFYKSAVRTAQWVGAIRERLCKGALSIRICGEPVARTRECLCNTEEWI